MVKDAAARPFDGPESPDPPAPPGSAGPLRNDANDELVGEHGDLMAWRYHLGTMQGSRQPVARRLVAGLGSAMATVAAAPSVALRRTPLRGRDRAVEARRLVALQALATELAAALTTAQITDLLMARGIAALRADGSAVFLIDPDEDEIPMK